jgi:hypothetical protein
MMLGTEIFLSRSDHLTTIRGEQIGYSYNLKPSYLPHQVVEHELPKVHSLLLRFDSKTVEKICQPHNPAETRAHACHLGM